MTVKIEDTLRRVTGIAARAGTAIALVMPGDNLSLQAGGDARIQLFSAATYTYGSPPSTHHGLTRERVINHELLNAGLRNSVLTGTLPTSTMRAFGAYSPYSCGAR